jgi:hypothetical protein
MPAQYFRSSHTGVAEDSCLRCDAVLLDELFPKFRGNVLSLKHPDPLT